MGKDRGKRRGGEREREENLRGCPLGVKAGSVWEGQCRKEGGGRGDCLKLKWTETPFMDELVKGMPSQPNLLWSEYRLNTHTQTHTHRGRPVGSTTVLYHQAGTEHPGVVWSTIPGVADGPHMRIVHTHVVHITLHYTPQALVFFCNNQWTKNQQKKSAHLSIVLHLWR